MQFGPSCHYLEWDNLELGGQVFGKVVALLAIINLVFWIRMIPFFRLSSFLRFQEFFRLGSGQSVLLCFSLRRGVRLDLSGNNTTDSFFVRHNA